MNRTTRCLALVIACYVGACSEPGASSVKPAESQPPKAAPTTKPNARAFAAPEHSKSEPKVEALVGTSPTTPTSLVDRPLPTKSAQPGEEDPGAGSEKLGETSATLDGHEEPEAPKPSDFDRPLEPKEVKIDRFVLATGVEGREPVGETDTFTTDTKQIFAFVQVANEQAPYAFNVHWESADGPAFPYGIKLTVPTASRWRTWAFTRIQRDPGRYRAVLRTLDGEEIASREFLIEAADGH